MYLNDQANEGDNMLDILILIDNQKLNSMIKEILVKEKHSCTQVFSMKQAQQYLMDKQYALLIVDQNFIELVEHYADYQNMHTLVIVTDQLNSVSMKSKQLAFENYLTTPVNKQKLITKISTLIKSSAQNNTKKILSHKGINLNEHLHNLSFEGQILPFTSKEYKIIKLLMENPNRIFTRQEIYERVWKVDYMDDAKTINVHVFNIRKKLRTVLTEEFIETIWGVGFTLKQ